MQWKCWKRDKELRNWIEKRGREDWHWENCWIVALQPEFAIWVVPKDHRHKKARRNLPKVLIWVRLSYFQIASSLASSSKFQRQAAHGRVASRAALGLSNFLVLAVWAKCYLVIFEYRIQSCFSAVGIFVGFTFCQWNYKDCKFTFWSHVHAGNSCLKVVHYFKNIS